MRAESEGGKLPLLLDPEMMHGRTEVVEYRVKDGDSLESLAEEIGWTWQDLAILNWGTREPAEINFYLKRFVGCRKNAAGHYVFSSSDEPGIIYLPKPYETERRRIFRGTIHVSRYLVEES